MASAPPPTCDPSFDVVLRLATPFGPCVGVRIPEHARLDERVRARLAGEEVAFAEAASPARARSFVAGRLALREAFAAAGLSPPPPLLPKASGAPALPAGAWGSISHKANLAVAIATAAQGSGALGIDLEDGAPGRIDIAPRVLVPAERAAIAHLSALEQAVQTRMAFSIKEAIYKAAHPVVEQFFGFQAAEVALPVDAPSNSFVTVASRLLSPYLSAKTAIRTTILLTSDRIISLACAVGNNADPRFNE